MSLDTGKQLNIASELADVHNDFTNGKWNQASAKIYNIHKKYQSGENQINVYKGIRLPKDTIDSIAESIDKESSDCNISSADLTKSVIGDFYKPSDNPDEVKAVLETKVKYYNAQMQIYRAMIQVNYNMLQLTHKEAASMDTNSNINESILPNYIDEGYTEIYDNIRKTEAHMKTIVENYTAEEFVIDEGVTNALHRWVRVLKTVKNVIVFLIKLITTVLKIINAIIDKIKIVINAFRKGKNKAKKFGKKMTTSVLVSENARLVTYDAEDWDVIEKNIVGSCVKITAKIKQVEKNQTETLKKLEAFVKKKVEEEENRGPIKESYNYDNFDKLLSLL